MSERKTDSSGSRRVSNRRGQATPRTRRSTQTTKARQYRSARKPTSGTKASAKNKGSDLRGFVSWFDNPAKRITTLILACLIVLAAFALGGDIIATGDTIHPGVRVEGIELGGMSKDDAKVVLGDALQERLSGRPVALFADEAAMAKGVNKNTEAISTGVESYQESNDSDTKSKSWTVSADAVGAWIDFDGLTDQALSVGKGLDLLAGRLATTFGGVDISAKVSFDPTQLQALNSIINAAIGTPTKNASIKFNGSGFDVVGGTDGIEVASGQIEDSLSLAFLNTERAFVAPLAPVGVDVTKDMAKLVATAATEAIQDPIVLDYEGKSVQIGTASLGSWISAAPEQNERGTWKLVGSVNTKKLKSGLPPLAADLKAGVAAKDARFKLKKGKLTIVESKNGQGVDYEKLTADFNAILFGDEAEVKAKRTVYVAINTLEPKFSTADAQALKLNDKIASYSTYYGDSTEARKTNIKAAAKLLNNSLVAPGKTWSFTGLTGECTTDKGFVMGVAIGANNEHIDALGGGICQVATTVFNAVFDAGLPIEERNNHSLYMSRYPDGRDAAVAYPSMDLKFSNDTAGSMLLTMTYNGAYLTATLWGTDPGRKVKYEKSAWKTTQEYDTKEVDDPKLEKGKKKVETEGIDGKSITVTRWVYDKAGKLLREGTFRSSYQAVDEVVNIGTKEPAKAKESKEEKAASAAKNP